MDDETAAHGGDRGFVERSALPPALAEVAFSLPIGQLSEVIETPPGYHLIEVIERRPAGVLPFEAARPAVEQTLLESERHRYDDADYIEDLIRAYHRDPARFGQKRKVTEI